jgi:hypothetical protein
VPPGNKPAYARLKSRSEAISRHPGTNARHPRLALDVLNVVSGTASGVFNGDARVSHHGFALRARVEAEIFSSLAFEAI